MTLFIYFLLSLSVVQEHVRNQNMINRQEKNDSGLGIHNLHNAWKCYNKIESNCNRKLKIVLLLHKLDYEP